MTKTTRPTLPPHIKTAYGLLSFIGLLALAEPKRMRMREWWLRPNELAWRVAVDMRPACGSAGCIGGWTSALVEGEPMETLGLTLYQQDELFMPTVLLNDLDQGTRAHAKRVVAHIKRFQKKYERQLRTTRLPVR